MNNHDDRNSGTHFLADVSSYAFSTDSLPSLDEARATLAREKIDTAQLKSWAFERLRGARARQKLAQAEIKRLEAILATDDAYESPSLITP
jgi:hypothetical protein